MHEYTYQHTHTDTQTNFIITILSVEIFPNADVKQRQHFQWYFVMMWFCGVSVLIRNKRRDSLAAYKL